VAKKAVINSFAKINLYLDVICKRPDGYHNIETIFQAVSLGDIVEIELVRSGTTLICEHPAVPTDESNLAMKAFFKLKEATGYDGGVRIEIRKSVPPGSGLGGGSSNAAAVLLALNRLMEGEAPPERLRAIARELGADVPFFLTGGLAAAWQIGDRILQLPSLPESFIVIAVPRELAVSTAGIYAMLDAPRCRAGDPKSFDECSDGLKACARALAPPARLPEAALDGSVLHNALEGPVISRHPEIGETKRLLLEGGARAALMSGSGSAVFGLADSEKQADEIKTVVEKSSSCDCFVTRTTAGAGETPPT